MAGLGNMWLPDIIGSELPSTFIVGLARMIGVFLKQHLTSRTFPTSVLRVFFFFSPTPLLLDGILSLYTMGPF